MILQTILISAVYCLSIFLRMILSFFFSHNRSHRPRGTSGRVHYEVMQ
jgi:hypothetical protein